MNALTQKLELRPFLYKKFILSLLFVFLLAGIDLYSKYYFVELLGREKFTIPFIDGYFYWYVTEHIGHAFEPFKTDSENNLLSLMIISGLLVVTSFFLLLRFPPFARFCLILIVSGGLANLIDKIYNINATNIMCSVQQSSGIYSVCFNLADFFVIFGVIFGLVYNFYFFIRIVTKNNALRLISISPVFVLLHLWMFDWLISSF